MNMYVFRVSSLRKIISFNNICKETKAKAFCKSGYFDENKRCTNKNEIVLCKASMLLYI